MGDIGSRELTFMLKILSALSLSNESSFNGGTLSRLRSLVVISSTSNAFLILGLAGHARGVTHGVDTVDSPSESGELPGREELVLLGYIDLHLPNRKPCSFNPKCQPFVQSSWR